MIMEALIIEKKVFNNVILKVRLEPVSFLHYLLILIDTDADSVTIKKYILILNIHSGPPGSCSCCSYWNSVQINTGKISCVKTVCIM